MADKKKVPHVIDTSEVKETKEQKLLRLAAARVQKACKAISLIGNLAAYAPTDEDIDRMMAALGDQCASIENRLRGRLTKLAPFSLREVTQPSKSPIQPSKAPIQ